MADQKTLETCNTKKMRAREKPLARTQVFYQSKSEKRVWDTNLRLDSYKFLKRVSNGLASRLSLLRNEDNLSCYGTRTTQDHAFYSSSAL